MNPRRIQLSKRKGWRKPANTIVVARPSKWGNPFVIEKHGDAAACVLQFRTAAPSWPGYVATARQELRGKDLACWCPPNRPCHADILLELANT